MNEFPLSRRYGIRPLPWSLAALKEVGYDGTITLEVFAPDAELLRFSVEKLRRCWRDPALNQQ